MRHEINLTREIAGVVIAAAIFVAMLVGFVFLAMRDDRRLQKHAVGHCAAGCQCCDCNGVRGCNACNPKKYPK